MPGWVKPLVAQATTAKGLLDIQLEEQRIREEKEQLARRQRENQIASAPSIAAATSVSTQLKSLLGVQAKNANGTWPQGSSNQQGISNLSLREIMEQEQEQERQASLQSQSDSLLHPKAAVGSWAAKAMIGTSQPIPFVAVKPNPSTRAVSTSKKPQVSAEPVQSMWTANTSVAPARPVSESLGYDGMPKEIAEWCESQLKRINNHADISLIQVCYSLKSAGEIREYLAEVLGSTPLVSQFASEFIKRKESLSNSNQAKKKRK